MQKLADCIITRNGDVVTFNSLFEMQDLKFQKAPDDLLKSAFNSLFEMLGVLVFGFCGFLSFVDGDVWVLQGFCWLWLFWFCLFVGVSGVEMCVFACFFSSASARAEKLYDVL